MRKKSASRPRRRRVPSDDGRLQPTRPAEKSVGPQSTRSRGRPSTYSTRTTEAICGRLVNGESLRAICKDGAMPSFSTVMRWLQSQEEFRRAYAIAREMQADLLADEILEIADDGRLDYRERYGQGGEVVGVEVDYEHIQRAKLRVDARKWYAAKLAPRKYGDRLQHANDPENPIPPKAPPATILPTMSAEEAMRIYREMCRLT